MAPPGDTQITEATETTALLSKDTTKSIDPLSNGTNGHAVNGNSILTDTVDPENGQVEEIDNSPLLASKPEPPQNLYLFLPAVGLGILLSAADQTLIVSSYGKIGSDLNALNNTSWVATAYFLTLTSFQPLYGKLSDIFGRKPALLFSYLVFGLGCLFCGLARNLGELVAARAFAGIGGGGMTTVVSILLSDVIPLRNRGTWQGYVNLIYAAGASAGAPLGGVLADSIGWRWAFLGQAPVCLAAFLIVYFVLDLPQPEQSHLREKLAKVDFLGAFTLIISVSSLLLGLDRGSNVGWNDTITITCCSLSIPLLAVFVFVEMKVAAFPFAPGHIIFERSVVASYIVNFLSLAGHLSGIFYVPLYLQVVDDLSAAAAGTRMIPPLIASVSGSLLGGIIMQRTGKYYRLTICSLALSVLGSIIIFLSAGIFQFSWGLIIGLCFSALGIGSTITTTLISVIANIDPKDQAIATACTYLFRSLGSVVGVSLGSTLVQQVLRRRLRAGLDSGSEADKIVERVRQSLDFIKELEPHTRAIVMRCYEKATTAAFGLTIAYMSMALIASFWIRETKLSR